MTLRSDVALYVRATVVRQALQDGYDVAVTTSRRGQQEHWQRFATGAGSLFSVRTLDPGRDVVEERLSDADGNLSEECRRAIARWYSE